ncbi:hypothetical protein [Gramella sp. MAR_2010_147]|uniref:hypothetical protein n=1 Tax=Gramella sp. MAR_2010_147 TaxID=1250205 RepID=UPI00087BF5D4|nr:hypothetical protein [Gramella sp. MAR_2010_147]SDR90356.1 hypothetical protein SAMN04488553_0992 [Gramella sp. MAR_2010_147]
MPKLIIRRNSEWANRMRSFELFLNGVKFSEIKDKQVLSFEIPEGKYQLTAKIDWCGSEPLNIEIAKDEIKRIEINGFIFSKYLLPLAIVTGLFYFGVYFKYDHNSLFLATLLMFFFGYMLYFMSIGHNQYLRLKEV